MFAQKLYFCTIIQKLENYTFRGKEKLCKMKKKIFLMVIILLNLSLHAQENEIIRYYLRLDSNTYIFIDNSLNNWFTIELKTDTLFKLENETYNDIFFADHKTIQIISLQFDNSNFQIMGNQTNEIMSLWGHKKWEFEYQKKSREKKIKSKGKIFYNKNGKPFLIWWIENPKGEWKGATIYTQEHIYTDNIDEEGKTSTIRKCTHQLFLYFIVNGKINVSITVPVLEDENLQNEISKLKNIANSLNVYGNYIDPEFFFARLDNPNYVFKDSLNLIEIEVPSWLNITSTWRDNFLLCTFPEKENIINSAGIVWEPKSNYESFEDFKQKFITKEADINSMRLISKEKNKEQYFLTQKNGWFYVQNVFIEGENTYCFVNFYATETTYSFNLQRFYDLIEKIKIK